MKDFKRCSCGGVVDVKYEFCFADGRTIKQTCNTCGNKLNIITEKGIEEEKRGHGIARLYRNPVKAYDYEEIIFESDEYEKAYELSITSKNDPRINKELSYITFVDSEGILMRLMGERQPLSYDEFLSDYGEDLEANNSLNYLSLIRGEKTTGDDIPF